jgi:hypothetical protein
MKDSYSYSFNGQNKHHILHIVYYFSVLMFWLYNHSLHPLGVVGFFLICVLILLFTMTLNNYKVIPTKKLGIMIYYLRLIIKVSFYFILVGVIPREPKSAYLVIGLFLWYIFIEYMFDFCYLRFRSSLFYNFDDQQISEYYYNLVTTKSYKEVYKQFGRNFLRNCTLLLPIFIWANMNWSISVLIIILSIELIAYSYLRRRK